MTTQIAKTVTTIDWKPKGRMSPKKAGQVVCSFLDTATTNFGRATHYNTREEQQKAELASHEALFKLDRDLYASFLMLTGLTNRARQLGSRNLLANPRNGDGTFLSGDIEREVLYHLIQDLPASAMFRLFDAFRVGNKELGIKKANNARTRKLILRTVLDSRRLELWAVKYRKKIRAALTHAWGQKTASFIRGVLAKAPSRRSMKDVEALGRHIDRYTSVDREKVYECVGFLLGVQHRALTLPLLKSFQAAKKDLSKGKKLPPEVLEGIRSTYHTDVERGEVLKISKDSLTKTQRKNVQRAAKKAGVEIEMDSRDYEAVDLYVYGFEMGMTDEIAAALVQKAQKAAAGFPVRYGSIGIVVDASRSMMGDSTQKLRPMATTLALRDMLQQTAALNHTVYCGGSFNADDHENMTDPNIFAGLCRPQGSTALAEGLIQVLDHEDAPEAVFVLSDGYENSPSGRFAEVVSVLREMGIDTPIYHLNPVYAAETGNIRTLHDTVPSMPVKRPDALGVSFLRGMIEADPVRGINALLKLAINPSDDVGYKEIKS